jgi:hypothetical protein
MYTLFLCVCEPCSIAIPRALFENTDLRSCYVKNLKAGFQHSSVFKKVDPAAYIKTRLIAIHFMCAAVNQLLVLC